MATITQQQCAKCAGWLPYRLACGGFHGIGSVDEYPFASTYEGGAGAFIEGVPIQEQWIQGGALFNFYKINNIGNGDKFRVLVK